MTSSSSTIRTGAWNQQVRDGRKNIRHGVKRTQSFLFMFGDISAMKLRKPAEKRPNQQLDPVIMSFLGHWSTAAPHPRCAQQLQRWFLLLPLTNDLLFFLLLYILSKPENLISLCPTDLFKESSGHKGDTWSVENNMNMVSDPVLLCGNVQFKGECPKGGNSYLNTVIEIMLILLNLMCFCIFMTGSIFTKKETILSST